MFPLPINVYIYAGLIVIALAGVGYGRHEHNVFEEYKAEEVANARAKEHHLQDATDQIRKDKDAQINAINNQLVNALIELRNRPSRTNQSSNNGQSGTGATLFAEDAEFLIREASRADQIRTALDACYKQYDEVTK
jgi:4-diphosphocytidyl-2C-methyl-D-erythritol kinase